VPHRKRPAHARAHPVHVTLRCGIRSLRSQFVFPTVHRAIAAANECAPEYFRIVEFSVQQDHIHLIVEAETQLALARGIRGLSIRVARRVNQLLFRSGRLFSDRWHGRELTNPRAVRHAIVYVLANHKKHQAKASALIDAYSSAPYFEGFVDAPRAKLRRANRQRELALSDDPPNCRARTWLLSIGWMRHGRLSVHEHPKQPA
jgi:REP element-mobilizing transposase RayT